MCRGELIFMEELGPHGRYVDACMVRHIRTLTSMGATTLGCCCGHGIYPMSVVVKDKQGNVMEYYSRKELLTKESKPRTRRFYVKDSKGFYYIPETVNAP